MEGSNGLAFYRGTNWAAMSLDGTFARSRDGTEAGVCRILALQTEHRRSKLPSPSGDGQGSEQFVRRLRRRHQQTCLCGRGRRARILDDERVEAAGRHRARVERARLPAGECRRHYNDKPDNELS